MKLSVFLYTSFFEELNAMVYYGAADNSICRVDIPLNILLE
ncbi:MAG: hypothetical protein WC159_04820 [Sphaerochaetaceae bacterium]